MTIYLAMLGATELTAMEMTYSSQNMLFPMS